MQDCYGCFTWLSRAVSSKLCLLLTTVNAQSGINCHISIQASTVTFQWQAYAECKYFIIIRDDRLWKKIAKTEYLLY